MSEKSSQIKCLGVLFDLDGTLVDSLPDIARATNAVRSHFGLPEIPVDSVRGEIGRGLENLFLKCLPEITTHLNMPDLIKIYREHYFNSPPMGALYPGVEETLKSLRVLPNITIAVVTNRGTRFAKQTLETVLPDMMFDGVIGSDAVSARKPNPAHLLEALHSLGLEASNSWYVGDHRVDWDCAVGAGVSFIGVDYGYGDVDFPQDVRIGEFKSLLKRLPLDLARTEV